MRSDLQSRKNSPRQPAPLKQRRVLWRRQFRRPAGESFQRVAVHHDSTPDTVHPSDLLALGRNKSPQGNGRTVLRLTRDIEADMATDQIHIGRAEAEISAALVDLHHRHPSVKKPA